MYFKGKICGDILKFGEESTIDKYLDGKYLCDHPAKVMAVYFTMNDNNPDPGSLRVYGCCGPHLDPLAGLTEENIPELLEKHMLIVNAEGGLEEIAYLAYMEGEAPEDFFSQKVFSDGKETPAEFWERVKKEFGF